MKDTDDEFPVDAAFGVAIRYWARAEDRLGIIVRHFSCNKKILVKLNDPKEKNPEASKLIKELKKCTRKEYEQFLPCWKKKLNSEEKTYQDSGGYANKGFDAFIKGLKDACDSRNKLVHAIGKKENEDVNERFANAFKEFDECGYFRNYPDLSSIKSEHEKEMKKFVLEHGQRIYNAAIPLIMFESWLQDNNLMPPPKIVKIFSFRYSDFSLFLVWRKKTVGK